MSSEKSDNASADGSGAMFDQIAADYDRLNRILSFGMDTGWRKWVAKQLSERSPNPKALLDVACGTGDLAISLREVFADPPIVGLDPSEGMLRHALKKDDRSGYLQGDGRLLPFADNSFSIVTVAFGIRNIRPREKAFAEFRRVLQPGGIVAILELCQEKRGLSGWLARIHTRFVVPILGGAFARSDAYRYLQTSIAEFPGPGEFAEELKENGLEVMLQKPFGLGAARLFLCRV